MEERETKTARMEWLSQRFEENRPHLRDVAYRVLGSIADAQDAVQETWLRLSLTENSHIENIRGWLTTVVSRVSFDMLRSRRSKREESLGMAIPDFIVSRQGNPGDEALLADSVGLALLIVLDTLTPAERLAFVLHDMFALPFEEIAPIIRRSSTAARKLASRARQRLQGAPMPDSDIGRQRKVVDAFNAAAQAGDFEALIAVLDPEVVLVADRAPALKGIRGAAAVAKLALEFSKLVRKTESVLVNGAPGIISWLPNGKPVAILSFVVSNDRIVAIYILSERIESKTDFKI